jgi:hypothetical protein
MKMLAARGGERMMFEQMSLATITWSTNEPSDSTVIF